jgi:transcriptional regulator NrdR family protein
VEERPLLVIKKDGTRQPFSREKLISVEGIDPGLLEQRLAPHLEK